MPGNSRRERAGARSVTVVNKPTKPIPALIPLDQVFPIETRRGRLVITVIRFQEYEITNTNNTRIFFLGDLKPDDGRLPSSNQKKKKNRRSHLLGGTPELPLTSRDFGFSHARILLVRLPIIAAVFLAVIATRWPSSGVVEEHSGVALVKTCGHLDSIFTGSLKKQLARFVFVSNDTNGLYLDFSIRPR